VTAGGAAAEGGAASLFLEVCDVIKQQKTILLKPSTGLYATISASDASRN